MSFNLVDLIKNELGDVIVDQVTGLLSETKENTGNALNGAIPGVLENLLSSASESGGADNLANTLGNMDENLLGNFSSMLTGGDHFSLIETGGKLLGSLLGNSGVSKIATTIAGFSGIKSQSAKTLIGLLAPVILGVIRKKMSSDNLDASGLLSMLNGQKENIAQAMPAGMLGVMDTETASPSRMETETTEPRMETRGKPGFGRFLWLPFLLLIGLFTYFFLPKLLPYDEELETIQPVENTANTIQNTTSDIKGVVEEKVATVASEIPDYATVGSDLGSAINNISDTLASVTDVTSATAAVPELTEASSKLNGLTELFNKLPETAKSSVSSLAANNISALQPVIDKVVEIPAVGPILKPVLDSLMEKLSVFTTSG